MGIGGEAFEVEWTHFPIFSSLSIRQEIQQDLERKEHPARESSRSWIIFVSMFNDFVWKKNDENCISNAEKGKNYAMNFSQGHWTFFGPGSEEKWYGSSSHAQKRRMGFYNQENGTAFQKKLVILCSKVSVLWVVGS